MNPIKRLINKLRPAAPAAPALPADEAAMQPILQTLAPFTLLGKGRLMSLYRHATRLAEQQVTGAFVECGTCRGGSAAVLGFAAKREGWKRELFLFDSFQGHPDTASAGAPDGDLVHQYAGTLVASVNDVKCALGVVDAYEPSRVHIIPGWFRDTLPQAPIPRIALLHLDGDWYDSTKCCLETYYDRVVSSGIVQIDDYNYELMHGCKTATDEFLAGRTGFSLSHVECALIIQKH